MCRLGSGCGDCLGCGLLITGGWGVFAVWFSFSGFSLILIYYFFDLLLELRFCGVGLRLLIGFVLIAVLGCGFRRVSGCFLVFAVIS